MASCFIQGKRNIFQITYQFLPICTPFNSLNSPYSLFSSSVPATVPSSLPLKHRHAPLSECLHRSSLSPEAPAGMSTWPTTHLVSAQIAPSQRDLPPACYFRWQLSLTLYLQSPSPAPFLSLHLLSSHTCILCWCIKFNDLLPISSQKNVNSIKALVVVYFIHRIPMY